MTDFADLPIETIAKVVESAYADDPDVEFIDGGIHDADAPHGVNSPAEMGSVSWPG